MSVRYIVYDVDAAIDFYCRNLGFTEVMHPAPAFAMLARGDLRLVLSAAGGGPGGGQAMPDGRLPEPGGWNRFSIEVPDLAATVAELRERGAVSAMRSSPAWAVSRSCWRTRPVTRWSSSSRPGPRPGCRSLPEPTGP